MSDALLVEDSYGNVPSSWRERLLDLRVEKDSDILLVRRISQQIALLLQCSSYQQSSLGAAVSDVVRLFCQRGQTSSVLYLVNRCGNRHAALLVEVVSERAATGTLWWGLEDIEVVDDYDGRALNRARRLVDGLNVDLTERGTRVTLRRDLSRSVSAEKIIFIRGRLKNRKPGSLVEQLQLQNQELIRSLETYQAQYRQLLRNQISLEESHSLLLETNEKLKETAARDPLTGLSNRLCFKDVMQEKLHNVAAKGEPFSIILFDVDDFKLVNDLHGHSTGDLVLVGIADVISARLRHGDWFFRIGGEEFIIILESCDLNEAASLASQLRECIENHRIEDLGVTCSFGVTASREGDDYHSIFDRVDAAMYRAKQNGKNRVETAG